MKEQDGGNVMIATTTVAMRLDKEKEEGRE